MTFPSLLIEFFSINLSTVNNTQVLLTDTFDFDYLDNVLQRRLTDTNDTLTVSSELLNTGYNLESSSVTNATGYVRNMLQHTIPDTKLFYPEPFIASPSYIHTDLTYLHILQY